MPRIKLDLLMVFPCSISYNKIIHIYVTGQHPNTIISFSFSDKTKKGFDEGRLIFSHNAPRSLFSNSRKSAARSNSPLEMAVVFSCFIPSNSSNARLPLPAKKAASSGVGSRSIRWMIYPSCSKRLACSMICALKSGLLPESR